MKKQPTAKPSTTTQLLNSENIPDVTEGTIACKMPSEAFQLLHHLGKLMHDQGQDLEEQTELNVISNVCSVADDAHQYKTATNSAKFYFKAEAWSLDVDPSWTSIYLKCWKPLQRLIIQRLGFGAFAKWYSFCIAFFIKQAHPHACLVKKVMTD